MELLLERKYCKPHYTIGKLYVDNVYLCDTLEPPYGATTSDMTPYEITRVKARSGLISIPKGSYQVIINHSPRFHKDLPLLLNVPGYEGIRIHTGNTVSDTVGCILVGYNRRKGMVLNSRSAMYFLMEKLNGAVARKEKIWITIDR